MLSFPHLEKSYESYSVWGARPFQALWHYAEELFSFINYFSAKKGFFKLLIV